MKDKALSEHYSKGKAFFICIPKILLVFSLINLTDHLVKFSLTNHGGFY